MDTKRLGRTGAMTVIALAALMPAAPAGAARHGAQRPIKAVGAGSGPIDLATFEYEATSTFRGSHVGNGTATINSATGTAVVTAANGDELHIVFDPTYPGGPLPTDCPTDVGIFSGPYSGAEFIVGGTGRFADASGYITFVGCQSISVDPDSPTGFTFAFTFDDKGWISY